MHKESKKMAAQTPPSLIIDMLRQSLAQGETPFLTISSGSMAPMLKIGDQIGLEPVKLSQLTPGDMITLAPKGDLLTHRFWEMENGRLRTRGDRLLLYDPLWASDDMLGRVIMRKRNGRSLYLTFGRGKRLNRHLARLMQIENKLLPGNWFVRQLHRGIFIWATIADKVIQ